MKKRRMLAALTAVACLMSGSSLVYADGAADVAAFLNVNYDNSNVTIYDGTNTENTFQMMGKLFSQGLVFSTATVGEESRASINYNVEAYDSLVFTVGHIDNVGGYDSHLYIYLDGVATYHIYCSKSMNTAAYHLDTSGASTVRFYMDDVEDNQIVAERSIHYGLANFVLNSDFTAVPENAYPNYLKIIELDKSKFGDLNQDGVVDSIDASLLLSAAASVGSGGESGLTQQLEIYADLDDSGAFDASDASTILQYAAAAGTGYEEGIDAFLKQ